MLTCATSLGTDFTSGFVLTWGARLPFVRSFEDVRRSQVRDTKGSANPPRGFNNWQPKRLAHRNQFFRCIWWLATLALRGRLGDLLMHLKRIE